MLTIYDYFINRYGISLIPHFAIDFDHGKG